MSSDHGDEVPAAAWHGHTPDAWARRWGVPRVLALHRTGSTNDRARDLAQRGAPAGTVVLADQQTRGRGRMGRAWSAGTGQSLLLSIVLRSDTGPTDTGALPLRLGLAVAAAIEAIAPVRIRIKWPNDLLIGERKVGGILCEGALQAERPLFIIAGIGLNVRQEPGDWTGDLAGTATSIDAEAGSTIAMPDLAGRVVAAVLDAAVKGGAPLRDAELRQLHARDALRGRPIAIDGAPRGIAAGIAEDGALIVEENGTRSLVHSGTIRPLRTGNPS